MEPEIKILYCCKCERETSHRTIDDDDPLFENRLECMVCQTVWEVDVE